MIYGKDLMHDSLKISESPLAGVGKPDSESIISCWTWNLPTYAEKLGFKSTKSGALLARSIMLNELSVLLNACKQESTLEQLEHAVLQENVLGKPTYSSRKKSFGHLVELYGLSNDLALFRTLRKFHQEEPNSLPQLAIICAFCRDLQLRESFRLIEKLRPEANLIREDMEVHLERMFPDRYSEAMKKSLAQNVNTSWRDSGHLKGRSKKQRIILQPTVHGTVFSMLAGYLMGLRGTMLTDSVFSRLVGVDPRQAISNLQAGAIRGWCKVRHAGDVLQIDFSPLLTPLEMELVHGAP